MVHERAELLRVLGADARQNGDHPLLAQLRAEIVVIVILRVYAHRILDVPDAPARSHSRFSRAHGIGE